MNDRNIKKFLQSFFILLGARVKEVEIDKKRVVGIVGWEGEDGEQFFSWQIGFKNSILLKMKSLCDFLLQHNLTQNDKISISKDNLKNLLQKEGWKINEAELIIDNLCLVEIKMVDDGEITDSFFLHF